MNRLEHEINAAAAKQPVICDFCYQPGYHRDAAACLAALDRDYAQRAAADPEHVRIERYAPPPGYAPTRGKAA